MAMETRVTNEAKARARVTKEAKARAKAANKEKERTKTKSKTNLSKGTADVAADGNIDREIAGTTLAMANRANLEEALLQVVLVQTTLQHQVKNEQ
eukprot:4711138-Amphidinium_carterae.1